MNQTKQQRDIAANMSGLLKRKVTDPVMDDPVDGRVVGRRRDRHSFVLAVDRIRLDADQVRQRGKGADDPETKELAQSIEDQGLRNYPEVRWIEADGIYEIVSGERRFTACTQVLGWEEIPVKVVDVADSELLWLQLAENIHRKALSPLDLAEAVQKAFDQGMGIEQVAGKLRKSKAFVQKALTVGKQLSAQSYQVLAGTPYAESLEVAYQLATAPEDSQRELAQKIVEGNLNQRQVIDLASQAKREAPKQQPGRSGRSGRPAKRSRPFKATIKVPGQVVVTVQFRKSKVRDDEVIAALSDAVERYQQGGRKRASGKAA